MTRTKTRKSTRKSPLSRLNGAIGTSYPVPPLDWEKMEAALGHKLSSDRRDVILGLIREYLFFENLERAAPFAKDQTGCLCELRAAATDFERTIGEFGAAASELQELIAQASSHEGAPRFGLVEVQVAFDRIAKATFPGQSFALQDFANCLIAGIDSVNQTQRPPGLAEGTAWRRLVRAIDAKFREWGLPTGLRHDGKTSPFAAFFNELQSCLPIEARRHAQSSDALSSAMTEARSGT
jgi:hypothetical protein